uniref:AB hydrolase-1 domain-containing protein n=1 Tax=Anopheles dirus TaxID=7168 RepID=A0A182N2Y8_9DIPT
MDRLVIGCLGRARRVCRQWLQWIVRWLLVAFWIAEPRPFPPDTLNHSQWGEHRFVKIHKLKLHYVEKGSSDKPLMLFLHGLPDFWYTWRHQLHHFSREYWTIALDLPGFGQSEKPIYSITYKLNNLAGVVKEFVTVLGKSECILVGSEAGAMLGWHIINQYPETVSKYVMIGMPSVGVLQELYIRRALPLKVLLRSALYSRLRSLAVHLARADDYAIFDRLLGATAKPQDVEAYKYTFAQPLALERVVEAFHENFKDFLLLKEYDFRVRKSANIPGLFLFDDCLIDANAYIYMLLNIYRPLETRFLPRAGSLTHQTDPTTVNRIISDFLLEDGYLKAQLNRSTINPTERKIIVKEVCDNCHTKDHSRSREASDHHLECVANCGGKEHWHYMSTGARFPISS